ncbi:DUF885 domain-containing protein [Ferrimonas marina]|uniref:Uncharacterized conserved protein, DUF885 familyt n=1 Tax=Ferrimonas marina TaxID=299255 RepID=A0A1M5Z5D3_9GAMM|nr:DUF885 domain-containing protein [Ferrimonas marina]SHI19354.1 Uncharacterized conserved protein, DUF885 familyt [Ferrimonas marina]
MKQLATAALVVLALGGCQSSAPQSSEIAPVCDVACQQAQFDTLANTFIDELLALQPEWALYAGDYQYAQQLTIPDAAYRQRQRDFAAQWRARFDDLGELDEARQIDLALMRNQLDKMLWYLDSYQGWQWNPANYNVAGPFGRLLSESWADEDTKLRTVLARMEGVPAYYRAGREALSNPTQEHLQLAVLQNQGALSVFDDSLLGRVAESNLDAQEQALFEKRYWRSRQAIQSYISFLERSLTEFDPQTGRDFRLGEALYEQKFALDIQAEMTAAQLYDKAKADQAQARKQMVGITKQLWPKYFRGTAMPRDPQQAVRAMVDHLSQSHVSRDNFVAEVKRQIPELEQFVVQQDLITLDPDKPLVVRETPPYMRGIAGASISAPGPFEKQGNTYYNVTPLDGLSDEAAESYLREYNDWMLQILNIHEAIPGHYTQLVYANLSPSLVKSLLANGAMIEGWAVYAERMMLEQGYGDFEPELWLMYWKWNLRVISNTLLDYGVHVKGMSQEEAMDLLVNQAYQQEQEAKEKWRRVTLSQVQLTSYYAGFREILDLREQLKSQQKEAFELKAFHEQFLSYGNAPVGMIRQLML